MTTTTVPLTRVEQTLDALHAQRDGIDALTVWLSERHDTLTGFYIHPASSGVGVCIQAKNAEQMAEAVRIVSAGAPLGTVEKGMSDDIASVTRRFGVATVKVYAMRANVCERIVVGTETVEVPDPSAPMVTVEREVSRWECKPFLAGGDA